MGPPEAARAWLSLWLPGAGLWDARWSAISHGIFRFHPSLPSLAPSCASLWASLRTWPQNPLGVHPCLSALVSSVSILGWVLVTSQLDGHGPPPCFCSHPFYSGHPECSFWYIKHATASPPKWIKFKQMKKYRSPDKDPLVLSINVNMKSKLLPYCLLRSGPCLSFLPWLVPALMAFFLSSRVSHFFPPQGFTQSSCCLEASPSGLCIARPFWPYGSQPRCHLLREDFPEQSCGLPLCPVTSCAFSALWCYLLHVSAYRLFTSPTWVVSAMRSRTLVMLLPRILRARSGLSTLKALTKYQLSEWMNTHTDQLIEQRSKMWGKFHVLPLMFFLVSFLMLIPLLDLLHSTSFQVTGNSL